MLLIALARVPLQGIVIQVDYLYDTEGFLENPSAKAIIEAVAARWSGIVNQTPLPVEMCDESFVDGWFQIIYPMPGFTC